jgi:hypothetical protein
VIAADVEAGAVRLAIDRPLVDAVLGPGARLVADRQRAVLAIEAVATFGIDRGRVTVERAEHAVPLAVGAWLDGLVTGLALAQAGRFALHANLAEVGGAAIACAGPRGAGKTTTSLLLAQRGAQLLGDDLLVLEAEDGGVTYSTTGRAQHVLPDTAAALGVDVSGAERLAVGREKLVLPGPPSGAGRLAAVVVLDAAGDAVERRRLTGADAVRALRDNAYRLLILRRIWPSELFEWAGAVAAAVPVHRVTRPAEGWSGDEVAGAVEAVAAGVGSAA